MLTDNGESHIYELAKFVRSNQGTCINQRPIVNIGERVEKGQVIADGPATDKGEISLGKKCTYRIYDMGGYNYEDAVLINEKIVRDDVYTSIHIEEYEIEARDTKLGPEDITRDIPNIGDDALKDLDENGIIRIGARSIQVIFLLARLHQRVKPSLQPKKGSFVQYSVKRQKRSGILHSEYPRRVRHCCQCRGITRENSEELSPGVNKVVRCYIAQKRKLSVGDKMAGRHGNKGVVSRILPQEDMPSFPMALRLI
jgi:DNA-directed RNA polymerase subunit beta